MNHKIVHFELQSSNPAPTIKFFQEAFDWSFQPIGDQYWLINTGSDQKDGLNMGSIIKKDAGSQPLLNSILVSSIDEGIKKIEKAGGKIVVPKTAIPSSGWLAHFIDPEGTIHVIWEDDLNAK